MVLERLVIIYIIFNVIWLSPQMAAANEITAINYPFKMKVHFIDVGQGDSILIETPSRKTILIDGGPPEAGKTVTTYLKENNIKTIDLLISTHPHIDHIGGLPDVIKQFPIKKLIDSGQTHSTKTYHNFMKLIKKKEIPISTVKRDDEIKIDPFLHINVLNSYTEGNTHNEAAIALQIVFNKKRFLLMSDVEKRQEREIMEHNDLKSDIIKIGHHGSKTSSSLNFLQKVRPDIAMLTYDVTNEFGHPTKTVINNLQHLNVDIYSTAVFGHTIIVTDGHDYLISPNRSPMQNIVN